jgi:serpin B
VRHTGIGLPALLLLFGGDARAQDRKADVAAAVRGNTQAALDLYARLRDRDGNLFFAPYSLSAALAMTYAGARGETAEQMARALHFTLPPGRPHPAFGELVKELGGSVPFLTRLTGPKRGYRLSTANALWGQRGYRFEADFLRLTRDHYGAGLGVVDFQGATEGARQAINAWAEKETQGRIRDLLPKDFLNPSTRLVLTNAVYFKGDWASPFRKGGPPTGAFFLGDGREVQAALMHQTGEFAFHDGGTFQALELPYAGKQLSMVVLLPRRPEGLGDLEKALTADTLAGVLAGLRKQTVAVTLPRFKVAAQFKLKEALSGMGMPAAFSSDADFSGMVGRQPPVALSEVVHKAFVEVNEEGAEAAAATAVDAYTLASPTTVRPLLVVFRADHPFVFLIRDNRTGTILFLGRLVNPGA